MREVHGRPDDLIVPHPLHLEITGGPHSEPYRCRYLPYGKVRGKPLGGGIRFGGTVYLLVYKVDM